MYDKMAQIYGSNLSVLLLLKHDIPLVTQTSDNLTWLIYLWSDFTKV